MKIYSQAITLLVVLASSSSLANNDACRLIDSTKERMACFDKQSATTSNDKKGRPIGSLDLIEQENEKLNKTTKSICRGC